MYSNNAGGKGKMRGIRRGAVLDIYIVERWNNGNGELGWIVEKNRIDVMGGRERGGAAGQGRWRENDQRTYKNEYCMSPHRSLIPYLKECIW